MNHRLRLRQVSAYAVNAQATLARWQRETGGIVLQAGLSPLPADAALMRVQAFRDGPCWSGWLDLEQWTTSTLPGLASMAPSVRRRERMLALFRASTRPLDIPIPELDYDSLAGDICVDTIADGKTSYLALSTPQGTLWMEDLPAAPWMASVPAALSPSARGIPLELAFCRGDSMVRLALLARLRPGDVMLIAAPHAYVSSAGLVIAGLTINENGKMTIQDMNDDYADAHGANGANGDNDHMSLHQRYNPSHDIGVDTDADASRGASGTSPRPATTAEITLRVEFVLQRQVMTVGQLDQLFRGQVLQLDPQAEQQVELSANGICLARGELVEFNGRLGVEVHQVPARAHVK